MTEAPEVNSPQDLPQTPARLGGYRIEAVIGRGGMGEVFLGFDERLRRHVAIKRIRADLPVDRGHRARFRREARAVARLSHPAIVQVFELLEIDDGDCIVMERVEGSTLAESLSVGDLELDTVLRLGSEIAEGLAEAHSKGLVHRDLKAENVLVTQAGHAKILDFGLARMLWSDPGDQGERHDIEAATLTRAGALMGTLHAMSPEQATGRSVDHRCDLFALGALLYQMLTGRPPFLGDHWLDTLHRVTSTRPEPLALLRPGLPVDLVTLVEQLLAKDPGGRPPNARVVADALERLRSVPGAGDFAPPARVDAESSLKATRGEPRDGGDSGDLPTAEWTLPTADAPGGEVETVVRTLLRTEVIDRGLLPAQRGVAAADSLGRYDRRLRDLVARHGGAVIEEGDALLALFERPSDAVACALLHHRSLSEVTGEPAWPLAARTAIHLGEILLRRNPDEEVSRGAPLVTVEGMARTVIRHLARLGRPGQTLLSRGAFDLARRVAVGPGGATPSNLEGAVRWLAHGGYLMPDADEPLDVFEVGSEGLAPLEAPTDVGGIRRVLPPNEERLLGWRPAPGQTVPHRPNWRLVERLGEGGFGEVWLSRHPSDQRRVFKFCFDADRLRGLKREVTLFHLLKEALGHRDDIARILDWHFEDAPYFVESEYTEGGNLVDWVEEQGGFDAVPLESRLERVVEVAEALAAAHSVGVLHKDVKPENVLISRDREGRPHARLTDFGIGLLTDRRRLEAPGLTPLGFTATVSSTESTGGGTLAYLAPELVEGKTATVQSDLYSLGVLLYQMVVGDFGRTIAPGWERGVDDPLLVEDLATVTDGSPARRPASAQSLAERLRSLDERRRARVEARARDLALRRAQNRRRVATAVASVALAVMAIVGVMAIRENAARHEAEAARERSQRRQGQAEGLIGYMVGDLRKKLAGVGRLDILDDIGDQALRYFAAVPPAELSDEELARRSQALYQIGEVRIDQGRPADALGPLRESLALARELADRRPRDTETLFGVGQSYYWLGFVQYQRGALAEALQQMESYLAVSKELTRLEPEAPRWRLEMSYAHSSIGSIQEAKGDLEAALAAYDQNLRLTQDLLASRPADTDLQLELAQQHNLVGNVLWRLGRLDGALRQFKKEEEIATRLVAQDPQHAPWLEELAISQNFLSRLQLHRGEVDAAIRHGRVQLDAAETLVDKDPTNVFWRQSRATGRVAVAVGRLASGEEPSHLIPDLRHGLRELTEVAQQRPFRHGLARARLGLVRALLAAGQVNEGVLEAHTAVDALALWHGEHPGDPVLLAELVEANVLLGRAQKAAGNAAAATDALRRALEASADAAATSRDPHLLAPMVEALLLLGYSEEALPLAADLEASGHRGPGSPTSF
ncbi:MAG: protein kinase [Acidobacteriota bacterium]